jgi:hypothetical protein
LEPTGTRSIEGTKRWGDEELENVIWVLEHLGDDAEAIRGVKLRRVDVISDKEIKSKTTSGGKWRAAGQYVGKTRTIEIADTGTTRRDFAHECGHAVANYGYYSAYENAKLLSDAVTAAVKSQNAAESAYRAAYADYLLAVEAENVAQAAIGKPSQKSEKELTAEHEACQKTTETRAAESERLKDARDKLVEELGTARAASREADRLRDRSYSEEEGTSARVLRLKGQVKPGGLSPHTAYAQAEWPDKPEEFYAEAFADWIVDPLDLSTKFPKVYAYFNAGSHRKD